MLKSYGIKDVGRCRNINQDYFFLSEEPVGNLKNLYVVADGMGGHRAGDLASEYTVAMVREAVRKSMKTNPFQIMKSAVEYANRKLLEKAKESPDYSGMGTTLVLVTIDTARQVVYAVNVGDSRLYRLSDTMEQITTDHSLVEEMVQMGKISREEARNHPDKNIITRAIGVADHVEADFFDTQLLGGECLLLCTDGLTNMVEDREIEEIMGRQSSLAERAQALVMRANENGGKDNIAVVVIEQE